MVGVIEDSMVVKVVDNLIVATASGDFVEGRIVAAVVVSDFANTAVVGNIDLSCSIVVDETDCNMDIVGS